MSRLIAPLIFGIVGAAILVSLGNWQVRRMAEKASYLAAIDARISQTPTALPALPDPKADRFLPVSVSGTLMSDELHVLVSVKKVGPGYRIISAFETDQGRRVMVDRGFIATPRKNDVRYTGPATITGNLHWPDEIDSFTPENDLAANIWFSRDVPTMAAALNAEPILVIAKTSSQNDPNLTPLPVDSSGIANDHLQYVVTWYGLAIVWAAMTLYYLHRTRRTRKTRKTKKA